MWDLTSYFPQFNGPEMREFKEALAQEVSALSTRAAGLPRLSKKNASAWEDIVIRNEDLTRRLSHLGSYISCLASADARNEGFRKEEAALARLRAECAKIRVELLRAVKEATDEVFSFFINKPSLAGSANYLKRIRKEARRAMSADKEILAADLGVDGIQAWGRLYDTVSSKLQFKMEFPDGRREWLPISQRRSLMDHSDRRIRRAAFEKGNEAWASIEDTAAGALNAIAGTRLTLNRHRGIDHFLDLALFQAAVSRQTLDAMFEALFARLEIPRRILRLKAQRMRETQVAWFDLGAPLELSCEEERSSVSGPRSSLRLPWHEATRLVKKAFDRVYPTLGSFFQSLIDRNWIDWEPRTGKRPGGFCTSSMITKESRIFMTYNESLGDVLTLAHEAGHAFHGYIIRDVRPYGRIYPMTLAETASTFGELALTSGIVNDPSATDLQKIMMLDAEVGHGAVYLLDIPVRYEFEKALYEERKHGELSVSRLKELMTETQRRLVGDLLLPGGEDPYLWASKLHFYITGLTFYNFPYTFGFLLSRGLFAILQRRGADFLPDYEEFLRLAGSDSAENVVKRTLGCDLERAEFWAEAIESLQEPLNRLEALLPKVSPASECA
jgi:oligoendopeptidase F